MTRSEKRKQAEDKRNKYALWIFDMLKARFEKSKDWDASLLWIEDRIVDKIKDVPQEKELILEGVKRFRDIMMERKKEISIL